MSVSLKGYKENSATFKVSGTVNAGSLVKLSGNLTVAACAKNDVFMGVALNADSSFAGIQTDGYVKLSYSGTTAPTVGYCSLAADGNGGIEVATTGGREILVTDVDTTAKTAGIIL